MTFQRIKKSSQCVSDVSVSNDGKEQINSCSTLGTKLCRDLKISHDNPLFYGSLHTRVSVVNAVSKMSVDSDTFTVYVQLFVLPVSTDNVLLFTLRSEE